MQQWNSRQWERQWRETSEEKSAPWERTIKKSPQNKKNSKITSFTDKSSWISQRRTM
jgi:hypothetical protein